MILIQLGTKIAIEPGICLPPPHQINQKMFGWKPNCLVGNIGYTKKNGQSFEEKKWLQKKSWGGCKGLLVQPRQIFFGCTFWEGKVFCYGYVNLEPKWGLLFSLEFRPCFGGLTFKNKGHWGSRNFWGVCKYDFLGNMSWPHSAIWPVTKKGSKTLGFSIAQKCKLRHSGG